MYYLCVRVDIWHVVAKIHFTWSRNTLACKGGLCNARWWWEPVAAMFKEICVVIVTELVSVVVVLYHLKV